MNIYPYRQQVILLIAIGLLVLSWFPGTIQAAQAGYSVGTINFSRFSPIF